MDNLGSVIQKKVNCTLKKNKQTKTTRCERERNNSGIIELYKQTNQNEDEIHQINRRSIRLLNKKRI